VIATVAPVANPVAVVVQYPIANAAIAPNTRGAIASWPTTVPATVARIVAINKLAALVVAVAKDAVVSMASASSVALAKRRGWNEH